MRISGGAAKGRKIGLRKVFLRRSDSDELRPTSAKVREAVFDIVGSMISGAAFLDLYAGAGGIGIEALSRGAGKAVFVESNPVRVKAICKLVSDFGFKEIAGVVRGRVDDFVKKRYGKDKYDIIFLDPPYNSDELTKALPLIAASDMLRDGGIVFAEHSSKAVLPDAIGGLKVKKRYKYGDTTLTSYNKNNYLL